MKKKNKLFILARSFTSNLFMLVGVLCATLALPAAVLIAPPAFVVLLLLFMFFGWIGSTIKESTLRMLDEERVNGL
jgi:hypothetical protein